MNINICKISQMGEIRMNIKVNEIGKIVDTNIELNGISVIAGHNTGKSTILKAMYIGLNVFRNSDQKVLREKKRSLYTVIERSENHFDDHGYAYLPNYLLADLADALCDEKILSCKEDKIQFSRFKEVFLNIFEKSIENAKEDELLFKDEFMIPLFEKVNTILDRSRNEYMKYYGEMYIENVFMNQLNNMLNLSSARIEIESKNGTNFICIKNNKISDMSDSSIPEPDAIYIPSYGILDIMNKSYRSFNLRYSPETEIKKYLRSTGENRNSYEEYSEINDNINIIKEIIEEVTHGSLVVESNGTIYFKDNELGKNVNILNAASGTKKFLIIEKLIENGFLRKGSILLIDEPETNLHPEWHLKFAEILVLLYKQMGIRSVINSHSPYFIRAIEVKMADHSIKEKGKYYIMKELEHNRYKAKDVTAETDLIYKKLYEPLEYL